MIDSNHALHALIEHLVSQFNATPNFDSTESGEKITTHFKVGINNFNGEFDIFAEDGEWFRNNYPNGFEILRIANYHQIEMPGGNRREYQISFSMEMLKKPEQIEEEEVIEDEDGTTISTRNQSVVAAFLGEGHKERFDNFSDAHKKILIKQIDLLHDLFAISSSVSAK